MLVRYVLLQRTAAIVEFDLARRKGETGGDGKTRLVFGFCQLKSGVR